MASIQESLNEFKKHNFQLAEKIAIENIETNPKNMAQILATIFKITGHLDILSAPDDIKLPVIKEIAPWEYEEKNYESAKFFYNEILKITPNDDIALNNLGLIYEDLKDYAQAQVMYEKSIEVKPTYCALYNLGVIWRMHKNVEKSLYFLERALEMEPNNTYANCSLGMTHFINKNFKEGYKYFLKKLDIMNNLGLQNSWQGEEYKESSLLIFCDAGLGDAIMYSRYFNETKKFFKTVKICARKTLINLFQENLEGFEFVLDTDTFQYDYSTLASNVPYYLGLDFDHVPNKSGYMKANYNLYKEYKKTYFDNQNLKIGIVPYAGDKVRRNARNRSLTFGHFEHFKNIPNATFYSLQKPEDIDETIPSWCFDLGKTFEDFTYTAAALKNLDCLISSDTSVIHLAGALGVKTYVLLPYDSDWRWFDAKNPNAWYDSLELFMQPDFSDWQTPINQIISKIQQDFK